MVMMGISGFKSNDDQSAELTQHGRYKESFLLLRQEIQQRAQSVACIHDGATDMQKAVASEAAAILVSFAEEAASPCVVYVEKDVDAWDERVKHLRSMVEMTSGMIFKSVAENAGVAEDDPRLESLKPVVSEIAEIVSRSMEASIAAANPGDLTPPAVGMTI